MSFLEWFYKNTIANESQDKFYKAYDFYNQPFSVDMLVNPNQINALESVSQDDPCIAEWVKSESLRLFDGWEKNADNSYSFKCFHVWYSDDIHAFVICVDDYPKLRHWEFKTLNEFITLANQFYSKLQWNESNPKVKEMFK